RHTRSDRDWSSDVCSSDLSEDRSQLLAMLTSMVEGVMVLDRRGRVLQINPALERMFDVTRMEARGHPCSDVFRHPQLDTLVSTRSEERRVGKECRYRWVAE